MSLKAVAVAVSCAVALYGCAQVPLEHREPFKVVEIQLPPEQVYAGMNKHPLCSGFYESSGSFNKADRSFEIRYLSRGVLANTPADFVSGELTKSGGTQLVMRSVDKWQTPISEVTAHELQTGSCGG